MRWLSTISNLLAIILFIFVDAERVALAAFILNLTVVAVVKLFSRRGSYR